MNSCPSSLESLTDPELRARLADLSQKYQRLIVHGDVVSRNDCREELHAIQRRLSGVKPAPKKEDDAFFGRGEKPATAAPRSPLDELRAEAERLRAAGKIRGPEDRVKIVKNGRDAIAAGPVKVQWIDVTPALATQWLENNFDNRPVSDDVVAAYARDMALGQWVSTHQGIAFAEDDTLIDGQHRLLAVVKSGSTVRMMVTFGLPVKIEGREMTTMDCVDRGRTRSVADQLKIQHGMKDGSIIAAICATLGSVCFGERTRRLSVGQTLEIFRAFEAPIQWVIAHRAKAHGLKGAGVLAAFAFALAADAPVAEGGLDRSRTARLYKQLLDGGEKGSPISLLHDFLTSDDAKLLSRGHDRSIVHLVLYAIDLELRGERVARLEPPIDGAAWARAKQPERVEKIAALFALP